MTASECSHDTVAVVTDFAECARAFVAANYPQASAALLGGSAASGAATETSDLDILVVLPDAWSTTSFVETTTYNGQLVEAFVYGPAAVQLWLDKGRREARPVLDRLIGAEVSLIEGDIGDELVSDARKTLAAGPAPIDAGQLRARRYNLSALVDDLEGAEDSGTLKVVMAAAWREAAELALLSTPAWIGTGKWLLRELRTNQDPFGLSDWVDSGANDHGALAGMCRAVLDSVGDTCRTASSGARSQATCSAVRGQLCRRATDIGCTSDAEGRDRRDHRPASGAPRRALTEGWPLTDHVMRWFRDQMVR